MNIKADNSFDIHHHIAGLLPWYVNKSLEGDELKAVESHLATCLVCHRERLQLEKLAKAVVRERAFDTAESASYERLKQRIHSQRSLPLPANVSTFEKPRAVPARQSVTAMRFLSWAVAAMLVLTLTVPLNFIDTGDSTGKLNQYKTLSDGRSEKLQPNQIRVVFDDHLNAGDKSRIIAGIHGQITGEPSLQGVYTVNFPETMTQPAILAKIGQLRKDNRVVFAEPAYALLSSGASGEEK